MSTIQHEAPRSQWDMPDEFPEIEAAELTGLDLHDLCGMDEFDADEFDVGEMELNFD